jgi:hypothetical protein
MLEYWQVVGLEGPRDELDRRPCREISCGCIKADEFVDENGYTYAEFTVRKCLACWEKENY